MAGILIEICFACVSCSSAGAKEFFGREIELWGVCAWLLVKGFSGLRLGVCIVTVLWVCGYWWSFVTKDWAWV